MSGLNSIMYEVGVEEIPSISNNTGAMNILAILEGYKLRFKELHWVAVNDGIDIHQMIDEVIDCISDTEDLFSEVYQGIEGVIIPGTLGIILPTETTPREACKGLITSIKEALSTAELKEKDIMEGIIHDMIKELYKFIYLLKTA